MKQKKEPKQRVTIKGLEHAMKLQNDFLKAVIDGQRMELRDNALQHQELVDSLERSLKESKLEANSWMFTCVCLVAGIAGHFFALLF